MEGVARVYAEALFDSAKDRGKLDVIHDQLGQFADAVSGDQQLQTFFFSPYFSSNEKAAALEAAIDGAEPELLNFLNLLIEKHRMPAIFRIRAAYDDRWAEENKRLEVTITSAIELDADVVRHLGDEIGKQTGRQVDVTTEVDDGVIGGLVVKVGNMVLDASIKSKLERLRREIAHA